MATAKATTKNKPDPKTAEKKVAPKKETTKKAAVKKSIKKNNGISGFERYKMIEVAAYYIAEKNGFEGHAADYWIAAEKEIDKKLAKK